ncbi:MAG: exopolysaccharide biosynthesis polyprenyl glycosylphosphotransferase [Bacteroidetes bacterium]|uniref:undecaprenyl-phosphate glucose phosphotransferase n=1 Tax=Chitinophaga sp. LS1 TaxID=3051176 RepID=UPI001D9B3D8C|nr:undecaprenyl-phosphate glucose phosphotransferase [Chitinophaga sp. LS1]MBP1650432.1 exopolysaccharide biosynthesis polyprenyl glycosylphosphotransferase [Bacteroidota bacterium]WPV66657.1 undecaprenyl-phosphate glucose phosphotransferase [Chitinophaga sp. LS1]
MKNRNYAVQYLRQFIDFTILGAAFVLTRYYISTKGGMIFTPLDWILLSISISTWIALGSSLRLYDEYDKVNSFSFEFVAVLKNVLLQSCVLTFLFFYLFKNYSYPRTFTLLYSTYVFAGVLFTRYAVKKTLLKLRNQRHRKKNVLIVGTGETGIDFYHTITNNGHFGYNCIGFVGDQAQTQLHGQYLGNLSELTNILEANEIDDVIVALPEYARDQTESIIVASERAAKNVKIIPNVHQYCSPTVSMNLLGSFPLVNIRSCPLDDPALQRIKRGFDIAFTLVLFTAFSWLFLLIAALIKLTSKGPVFFKQERWGLKNKKITCYKFRSMIVQTSEVDANGMFLQATRNDSRVTSIGRFLRKTNLDELPQFFNVLLGNMSFVGPRPHATPLHIESRETVQHYMRRQMVKPGITGWAQVNGCRGETSQSGMMQKRVDYDIWYIENYSFWLDCQIIFQTMVNMIKGDKNAY